MLISYQGKLTKYYRKWHAPSSIARGLRALGWSARRSPQYNFERWRFEPGMPKYSILKETENKGLLSILRINAILSSASFWLSGRGNPSQFEG